MMAPPMFPLRLARRHAARSPRTGCRLARAAAVILVWLAAAAGAARSEPGRLAGARRPASGPPTPSPIGPALLSDEARRAYDRALATGRRLFERTPPPISGNRLACRSCHEPDALAGVHRRYPRPDRSRGWLTTLEQQVARCINVRLSGEAPAPGSPAVVALLVYLKEIRVGDPSAPEGRDSAAARAGATGGAGPHSGATSRRSGP
jgi:cytochrome c